MAYTHTYTQGNRNVMRK